MNERQARRFAGEQMLENGETLLRAEPAGPFVVALVELAAGGYQNRVAQPAVILQGKPTKIAAITNVDTYGPTKYTVAARRFNSLIDEELA